MSVPPESDSLSPPSFAMSSFAPPLPPQGEVLPPPPPPGAEALRAAPRPRGKRRAGWIALGVVGVVAVVGTGVVVATDGDSWPSAWDPRAQALVDFVEANRGGQFEHPVKIEFLPEDEYVATLQGGGGPDEADADDEAAADDAAVLRAVGWIDAGADPAAENQELLDDGTLAYYLPGAHRVVVRGEPTADEIPAGLRVTLVHELTHAWQDQHFDLDRDVADAEEEFAFRSLVEGDAVRIEQTYLYSLPTDEQESYFDAYADAAADVGTDEAPGLEAAFTGPYVAGPTFAMALEARGGNARVDRAFAEPPTTAEQVLFPAVFDAGVAATDVIAPELPDGAEPIGDAVPGGAWDLLTTLGGRIDPLDAFTATRAWAGGTQQAWKTAGGQVCLGWTIGTDGPDGTTALRAALEDWVAAGPEGVAKVTASGTVVHFEACDAGDDTVVADGDRLDATIALVAAHGSFTTQAAREVDLPTADCAATALVGEVDPELFVREDLTDAEIDTLLSTAAGFLDECDQSAVTG